MQVKDGSLIRELSDIHVDNVYQTAFRNGVIVTGGQYRKIGVCNLSPDQHYYLPGDFLVYCVGLSPDASTAAFSASEENDVVLFNTYTKERTITLKGHQSTLTRIAFYDTNTIITSAEENQVHIWEIKN